MQSWIYISDTAPAGQKNRPKGFSADGDDGSRVGEEVFHSAPVTFIIPDVGSIR